MSEEEGNSISEEEGIVSLLEPRSQAPLSGPALRPRLPVLSGPAQAQISGHRGEVHPLPLIFFPPLDHPLDPPLDPPLEPSLGRPLPSR
jgi:hypothetical protein